jgi:hypothetical protein
MMRAIGLLIAFGISGLFFSAVIELYYRHAEIFHWMQQGGPWRWSLFAEFVIAIIAGGVWVYRKGRMKS